ncbi:hypothetical protein H2202_006300 [Exophiala xenobiotica]|nr:hypothetical protein H2202_006300 [Exophiala xenobiotica]
MDIHTGSPKVSHPRRPGQENRIPYDGANQRLRDYPRGSASAPHQRQNSSSFNGDEIDPIVLSDSEDEAPRKKGDRIVEIDLTRENESDHSINRWRQSNHKSPNSFVNTHQTTPSLQAAPNPLQRGSEQISLPRPMSIPQSFFATTQLISRALNPTLAAMRDPAVQEQDVHAPSRTPQSRPSGEVEPRTGSTKASSTVRARFATPTSSPRYSPARQSPREDLHRRPTQASLGTPSTTLNQTFAPVINQTLQSSVRRTLQSMSNQGLPDSIEDNLEEEPQNAPTDTVNNLDRNAIARGSSSTTNHVVQNDPSRQSKILACINCNRVKSKCDGLSPCTACSQRGDLCAYAARPSTDLRRSKIVSLNLPRPNNTISPSTATTSPLVRKTLFSKERTNPSTRNFESAVPNTMQHVTKVIGVRQRDPLFRDSERDNMPDEAQVLGRQAREIDAANLGPQAIPDGQGQVSGNHTILADESYTSDESSDSTETARVEPKVETIKAILEDLRKDLHSWREKTIQADLRQALLDTRVYSVPKTDSVVADPFAALTKQRRPASDAELAAFAKPQSRKLQVIPTDETPFYTGGTILPKYKAIGRVSSSCLAPGYRTAKYRPYDAEDEIQDPEFTEKYAEREQRFKNNYDSLLAQRNCQERVWLWKPWAEELFSCLRIQASDVLYYFTAGHFDPDRQVTGDWPDLWEAEQMNKCRTCGLADPESRGVHFSETFQSLPKPDDHTLVLAGLAAYAFHEETGVSLWHVAAGGLLQPRYEDPKEERSKDLSLCVICFRHQCPDHGSYEEPADEDHGVKDSEEFTAFINDEERDHNLRKFTTLPVRGKVKTDLHICGLFCVEPSKALGQILGRQADGSIGGDSRAVVQSRHILDDDDLCGPSCFWDASKRRNLKILDLQFQPFQSQSQKLVVDKALQFYLNNMRGPCLIAQIVKDVGCMKIFEYMVWRITRKAHLSVDAEVMSDSSNAQRLPNHMRKRRRPPPNIDTSRSAELDLREAAKYIASECADVAILANDASADCDPFSCGKCGVLEVLDSYNKYNEDVRKGRCKNNRIQLGLPAPTTKAPSQVQGYGLYSRAEIMAGDFIGEYTGEIISINEGDRRGAMYHVLNQEYLFIINKGQEIDASNHGNKMRFMNNSQLDEYINVEPKKLWCNGVVRLGLFAKRSIRAGEELLYNYNYPESVTKNFWEPGERPANVRRLIPMASERIARTTGANKLTEEQANQFREDSSQSPLLTRHPKRKRPLEESPRGSYRTRNTNMDGVGGESSADERAQAPEIGDSEDSDYESNSQMSDDQGEVDEESDDESEPGSTDRWPTRTRGYTRGRGSQYSSHEAASPRRHTGQERSRSRRDKRDRAGTVQMVKRKRKIGPHDKRFGGRAQQLAWQTRRFNESRERGSGDGSGE